MPIRITNYQLPATSIVRVIATLTYTINLLSITLRDFVTRSPISSSTFNTSKAFWACNTVGKFISIPHLYVKALVFVEDMVRAVL